MLSLPESCTTEPALPPRYQGHAKAVLCTENGDHITVLRTCTVPYEFLESKNWDSRPKKSNRNVRSIPRLIDGRNAQLYAKGGEMLLPEDLRVEAVQWEAVYLLELALHGFKAEEPQAIIRQNNGNVIIVTKAIQDMALQRLEAALNGAPIPCHRQQREAQQHILTQVTRRTRLLLGDDASHNFISGPDDEYIIDVIRWGIRDERPTLREIMEQREASIVKA